MPKDFSDNEPVWSLLTLTINSSAEEFAASVLFDHGATGTIILEEQADSLNIGAYFTQAADVKGITASVEAEFSHAGLLDQLLGVAISTVPDQDWMQKWKEGFEPIKVGERLIVAPSWNLPADAESRAVVQIDPGMAFGTGTHETTRLCMEFIEQNWRGGRLLDVGTGTGILAIAAALLQPQSRIIAVDIDPLAVEVAKENAAINKVLNSVEVTDSHVSAFKHEDFDVVVANLTAEVIVDLIVELTNCLGPHGLLILSGILNELANDVERAAEEAGLMIVERRKTGEWSALIAERP